MKKILLTMLLTMLAFFCIAQTSMYEKYSVVAINNDILTPRYLIGENGAKKDTLGIVITVQQAQKIDNDYELLTLYKSMHNNCDSTVSFLVQVVNNYKKMDIVAQARFKAYEVDLLDNNERITNLTSQIAVKNGIIAAKDGIINDDKNIISIDKLEIKKYKKQRNKLYEIGSGIAAILIWESICSQ